MMLDEFKILILFSIFLFLINFLQKKFNFCLDRQSKNESHKILLKLDEKVPLSGSFYFFPILFILTYKLHFIFATVLSLFFFIGLLSDLKIANSPKIRLFLQFFLVIIFLIFNKEIVIDTRIDFLNDLMNNQILRVLIVSFFIVVLINGFNFIDGVNNLCSLNILLIIFFLFLTTKNLTTLNYGISFNALIISMLVFVIFNFFGKNFLGDGGVYGLSFFLAIIIIKVSLISPQISPYFIANLLWYPALENLFSIFRRTFYEKKKYEADNEHLHQLLFKYLNRKKIIKQKYLLSSFVGILINFYLIIIYFLGYLNYSDTKHQLILILLITISYLGIYFFLKKNK